MTKMTKLIDIADIAALAVVVAAFAALAYCSSVYSSRVDNMVEQYRQELQTR